MGYAPVTDAAKMQKLLRQQTAIARFGSFALRELDLTNILGEAVRVCAEGLGVAFSQVCRYRAENNDLVVAAGYGWRDQAIGHVVSRADMSSPQGRAFTTGEPSICYDLPPSYAAHGIVSIVDVIIKANDGQPYGILEIAADQPRDYDQYDIHFLNGFASVLAEAVSTAARGAALKVTVDQMKSLVEEKDRLLHEKNVADLRLRQTQKMEAVGQLTGGIVHDLNNILTVITGTIEILAEGVADRPELVAITKMIAEAANLLPPALGENVEVHLMLAADASRALIDPCQLKNTIRNLALNARDAMVDGGKLTIETGNVVLDDNYASMNGDVTAGNYVMVAVTDSGHGIPGCILDHVFEPFFTTKEVGKGSGLGLSMVYGFVTQSNRHMKIDSEE